MTRIFETLSNRRSAREAFFRSAHARGARVRSDWQVTLETIARGTLSAPSPEHIMLGFSELSSARNIAAMMDMMPVITSKFIVDMTQ